jgi:hypothetical protein
MLGRISVFPLCAFLIWPALARATVYRVPSQVPTILEADDIAAPGDTILVEAGVHTEPQFIGLDSGTRVIGEGGASQAWVRGKGFEVDPLLAGDTTATIIEGLTLEVMAEYTDNGAVVVNGNPLTIVRHNRMINGGVVTFGGLRLEHNEIVIQDPWGLGFGVVKATWDTPGELIVAYNTIWMGWHGFDIDPEDILTAISVHHNTIVYLGWADYGELAYCNFEAATVDQSISSNIFVGGWFWCGDIDGYGGEINFLNNCFEPYETQGWFPCPRIGGTTNFEADPLLCDLGDPWTEWDWRLDPGSPCIGTGEGGTNIGAREVGCELVPVLPPDDGDYPAAPLGLVLLMPNPVNPPLRVRCAVPPPGVRGRVDIFDPAGRRVRTLADGWLPGQVNSWTWDGRGVSGDPMSSGTYFVRLQTRQGSVTQRVLLIR